MMGNIRKAAEVYKALASPVRLQIYLTVSERGEVGLKDMVSECGESYPLTIKHIKILEEVGLIESRKEGNNPNAEVISDRDKREYNQEKDNRMAEEKQACSAKGVVEIICYLALPS